MKHLRFSINRKFWFLIVLSIFLCTFPYWKNGCQAYTVDSKAMIITHALAMIVKCVGLTPMPLTPMPLTPMPLTPMPLRSGHS